MEQSRQVKKQQYRYTMNAQILETSSASLGCSAEEIIFGAYCVFLYRKTSNSSYLLGHVSGAEALPVLISVDGNMPAIDAVRGVLAARAAAAAGETIEQRGFAALFGTSDDASVFATEPVAGCLTALLSPEHSTENMRYVYDGNQFTDDEVRIHHMQFETVLADILENPGKSVKELNVLSVFERTLLQRVNDTRTPFSDDKGIHELIEDVSARQPDAPALSFHGEEISYDRFNRMCNSLARTLRAEGAGPGSYVAIAAERGVALIVSMAAVLKTGAAYVPLSPLFPPEYFKMVLIHCGAKLLLTTVSEEMAALLPEGVRRIDPRDSAYYAEEDSNLPRAAGFSPKSPAALIYTSGTTGRPKGVIVRHDTVVNYCEYNLREFHIDRQDFIMQFAPFPFSTSILEITTTLIGGAKLCLVPDTAVKDPREFYKEMIAAKATLLLATPEYISYLPLPETLRIVETGASECSLDISAKILRTTMHANAYGLTEGSVPTVWKYTDSAQPKRVPVGKPVPNTQVYILDKNDRICGAYMPGELCVTGLAVSDGYLGDPAMTAEKFVKNPFGDGIMLRTGDIAQWNAEGDVEYLGRADNQVQIRGMRVELEEVERTLKQLPGVASAAAMIREAPNGDMQLIAFVTPVRDANGAAALDPDALRLSMYDQLQEQKVPSVIVPLAQMPLTANGKVDKRKLAAIKVTTRDFAAPETDEQKLVARVFEETLGITGVGLKENFFALGGHSLRAARAANRLEELSGVRMPLVQWFDTPTVEGLAEALRTAMASGAAYTPIPVATVGTDYPMSPAQRRLYLACQLDDAGTAYNISVAVVYTGALDTERARAALTALCLRHEALRTSFHMVEGNNENIGENAGFIQRIAMPGAVSAALEVVSFEPSDTPESLLAEFTRPFELDRAPLMRLRTAIAPDGSRSILMIDIHHMISDGTTMYLLLDEFDALYNGKSLPETRAQYKDFSEWARSRDISAQQAYWTDVFADPPIPLEIATDFRRPRRRNYTGNETGVLIHPEQRAKIDAFAKTHGVTPFITMLAALMATLGKYSRQEDVTVGIPAAGRVHRDVERTAGMFVNTLVMRGYPARAKTFEGLLDEVRASSLLAFEHQEYPYESLAEMPGLLRDPSRNPLFDVMLTFQNTETYTSNLDGLRFERVVKGREAAKFDLSYEVTAEQDGYHIKLVYSAALFQPESAERMLRHYCALLAAAIAEPSRSIGDLPLTDAAEYEQVTRIFSGETEYGKTGEDLPDKIWIDYFKANATEHPDRDALTLGDERVTYGELHRNTDRIARWLASKGVGTEDIVAVFCGRGFGHVTGVLGTAKTGAAFLPIDAAAPTERVQFILKDSGAKALLVADAALSFETDMPTLDISGGTAPVGFDGENNPLPELSVNPDNLAYCIYTSGTSGTPKGVMLSHRGLVNLIAFCKTTLSFSPEDTILQFANCSFDASVMEIIPTLVCGAALRLLPEGAAMDPDALSENIRHCTIAFLTPPLTPTVRMQGLRVLRTAGSPAFPETVRVSEKGADLYINEYGPTEATVCATAWTHVRGEHIPENIPIGKPLPGVSVYILDGLAPCAVGVPGELCIGGDSVARGYINNAALTAEKFIQNPFGGGRLYRTGDIARWLSDGNIEYLGRLDDQVKVRGFRIELSEVETAMAQFPGVTEAAVIAIPKGGDKELIGYFTAETALNPSAVRDGLAQRLPEYMTPARLAQLDAFPRTASGKVNKRVLVERPLPDVAVERSANMTAPHTREEMLVAWVFCEILNVDTVSVSDNFFTLGGQSLLVIRAANMLESLSGIRLPFRQWFDTPTVEGLAAALCAAKTGE